MVSRTRQVGREILMFRVILYVCRPTRSQSYLYHLFQIYSVLGRATAICQTFYFLQNRSQIRFSTGQPRISARPLGNVQCNISTALNSHRAESGCILILQYFIKTSDNLWCFDFEKFKSKGVQENNPGCQELGICYTAAESKEFVSWS